jgi:hypothetical protein
MGSPGRSAWLSAPSRAVCRVLAVTALLVVAVSSALADDSVTVNLPDTTTRFAWVQDGYPSSLPKDPLSVASQAQLAVHSKTPETRVFVWDKLSGGVAEKKLSELKDATWDVKTTDFTEVPEVQVIVQYGGKPLAAAAVDLKDSARTQSQLLDSSTGGILTFYMVKAGKIETSVKYRSNGAMAAPVDQSFTVTPSTTAVPPTFTIAVPGPVETVAVGAGVPAANGSGSTGEQPATAPGGASAVPVAPPRVPVESNPAGSLVVIVVVFAAVAFVAIAGFKYVRKNPEKAQATLEQLGVQIPKPHDSDLNSGIPAVPLQAPAPPQPVQKIMLGDASPDPLAGSGSGAPISIGSYGGSAVAASPQLRSGSGDVIPISDGPLVVGRDAGLGLSLLGESTVSRRHAELVKQGDSVIVKDLGSTNGTYVNGSKLQGEVVLRPGDEVQFGAIRFRYEG